MNLFLTIFFFFSVWINFSSLIYKYFEKFLRNNSIIRKNFYFLLTLGFIFSFSFLAALNISLHFFGITFSNNYLLIPIAITIFSINISTIKGFYFAISLDIKKINRKFFYELDPFISIIILIIIIQVFCLFIRFLLPVTHTDALSQYFYDSLQISRLENLSISNYYLLGEALRTDSLASFFDAFLLQLSDSWFLVRGLRVIALILVLLNSIEMTANIGSISFKRGVLLSSVILTLPDVWDISLSGKHDIYAFLFELVGIYAISNSIIAKENLIKIIFLSFGIFIGFLSIGIRLSSVTFIFISSILLVGNLISYARSSYLIYFWKFISSIKISVLILLIFIIMANLLICIFNLKYFSNPFFKLSPPEFLSSFFPNAIYSLDYEVVKEALSLRNIPLLIKPLITILYSTFGVEPIRYLLNKTNELNNNILIIINYLNYIGPKATMVSILSFSPFTLLPFFGLKYLKNQRQKLILLLLIIWIILWSVSIPYTRVALASSVTLIIFGFSQSSNFKFVYSRDRFIDSFKFIFILFSLIYTLLFSFWSLTYLSDLPLKSLFNNPNYSRTELTRDYLNKNNKTLKKDLKKNIVPSKNFESKWKEIEDINSDKFLILKGAPKRFGYFMKKGLITSKKINLSKKFENKTICYEIDFNQIINKSSC